MRLTIPKLRTWHLLGIVAASAGFFSVMQFRWSVEDPGYALVRQLRSADADARAKAAGELRIRHPPERRAIGPLTEALFDSDARVRGSAADALGWIVREDDPEAGTVKAALTSAIGDRDKAARLAIAEALARFGPRPEVIVPTLVEFARGDDPTMRGDALFTLCYFARESEQARGVLLGALGDVDREVRSKAVSGLGHSLFSPRPAPEPFRRTVASALLGAANDEDAFVRSQVVYALGRLGDQTGEEFPRVIEALEDPSADVRFAASCWLGGRRRPNARSARFMPVLDRALSDPDSRVRRAVADALGSGRFGLDAEAALPALRASAQDPDAEARQSIDRAIVAIEKAADGFRSQTLPNAIAELVDPDPVVRVLAANRLEDVGPRAAGAVPALVRCLADREADVRRSAARALGQLGPGAAVAVPTLADLARSDVDERVRQAATLSRSILARGGGDAMRSP